MSVFMNSSNLIVRSHAGNNMTVKHLWHDAISTKIQCHSSVIHVLESVRLKEEACEVRVSNGRL